MAQPVPVVGARVAGGHFCLGQRLDLVQRLEVFQRLRGAPAGLLLSVGNCLKLDHRFHLKLTHPVCA